MKSAFSVLTVLWIVSATASPIPAQALAEPRHGARAGGGGSVTSLRGSRC